MYGIKILCEISKVPFEISHKILNPYTAKYAFYCLVFSVWFTISLNCDVISLSETGPWTPCGQETSYGDIYTRVWMGSANGFMSDDTELNFIYHLTCTVVFACELFHKISNSTRRHEPNTIEVRPYNSVADLLDYRFPRCPTSDLGKCCMKHGCTCAVLLSTEY